MANLQFHLINEDVETTSFDCGIESINDYIKNSYYPLITQQAYAYCIMYDNIVLGYYQIFYKELKIDCFPEDISGWFDYNLSVDTISAVHIRYIAIDKKYQRRKIGNTILDIIIKNVEDLSIEWPIRVITIDARNELVEWYKRKGFKIMIQNTPGQDGFNVAMYYDCMRHGEELEKYCNAMI